jgi:hypothetical protein
LAFATDATRLGLSTFAVGAVLYALAPGERPPVTYTVVTGTELLIWCYSDGMVGRLCLGLAAIEALLRLRLVLTWVEFLSDVFKPDTG